jgi:hypothetical protein
MYRRAAAAALSLPLFVLTSHQVTLAQTKPQTSSSTSVAKFVGTWKEDLSKRKGVAQPALTFRQNAKGALEELRGSELRPLVQPVNFTGKPYAIDESQNTIAWKQIDPNRFERAIYSGSRLLNTRRIQLSADGKTLTQETEAPGASGAKDLNTVIYRRETGDKGLVGRWRAESSKTTRAPEAIIEGVGSYGIKVTTRGGNTTAFTVMLDNKPVGVVGDAIIPGTMTAVRPVDASTLEFTQSREGVVTGKSVRVVSPDGKTMTVTTTQYGPNASKEPTVSVFVKQ